METLPTLAILETQIARVKILTNSHDVTQRLFHIVLTDHGRKKLDAAGPVHAESVRYNLLSRLTQEQIDTIVRVSNLLGEEE